MSGGKGVELAAGYISLTVKKDKDGFKEIEADVKGIEKTAAKSGEAAGKAISDGITSGAKKAGKAVSDELGKSAETAGRDAGRKAGDALGKEITKASKDAGKAAGDELDRSIGESAQRTGKKAGDSIGGMILDSVRQGAKDAGWSLEDLMQESAKKAGKAIGDALGKTALGDFARSLGVDGEQVVGVLDSITQAAIGLKQHDLAGTLNAIAGGAKSIGQNDAANVIQDLAGRAGAAQQTFTAFRDVISGGGDALKGFSGFAGGASSKIGSLAAAASDAAGPIAAFIAITQEGERASDSLNRKLFNNKQVFPSEGLPGSAEWFLKKGERLLSGENPGDVFTTGPGGPQSKPSAPVQGPHTVSPPIPQGPVDYAKLYGDGAGAPQTLVPPLPGGGAKAAPSGMRVPQGGSPLATALAANGSFSPEQIRLIQGFSKVEGNNPAGNPTLGFTDSQLGGASDLTSHVNALAKQFLDRAPVAGPFPAGGSDQQQAAWIAAVVGQNGSPSDWQGNAQPPAAVYQQRIINSLPPTGFDDGGQLLPGLQLVNNASGQPEIVLTQDQAKNAMQGMPGIGAGPSDTPPSSGVSPGPNGAAALTDLLGQKPDESPLGALGAPGGKDQRTQGYIPAGAGGKGTAGTSLWSGSLQLGAQAINGLIEQAGSAAATAISAAATAGSFGAGGQAAGPASSFLIGIGTKMAERGVSYGFQMAGIAGDALAEILSPFGVPRLFQTDPSQFLPQLPGKPAAVTTGEKAQQSQDNPAAANDPNINPAGPVQPEQMPGQQVIGPSAPVATPGTGNFKPEAPAVGPGLSAGPAVPSLAPTQPVGPQAPQSGPLAQPQPPAPPVQPPKPPPWLQPNDLGGLLGAQSYDSGGWLQPHGIAINQTNRPEPILNPQQFDDLHAIASQGMPELDPKAANGYSPDYRVQIENVTVSDVEAMRREIDSRQRLQMMRFAGRP